MNVQLHLKQKFFVDFSHAKCITGITGSWSQLFSLDKPARKPSLHFSLEFMAKTRWCEASVGSWVEWHHVSSLWLWCPSQPVLPCRGKFPRGARKCCCCESAAAFTPWRAAPCPSDLAAARTSWLEKPKQTRRQAKLRIVLFGSKSQKLASQSSYTWNPLKAPVTNNK